MGVVSVILLNMLLAILMDAYNEVHEELSSAQTLPTQMSELIRRHRQSKRKERVKLNDIWDALAKNHKDEKTMLKSTEPITPAYIENAVPGIPKSQAKRTLGNAKKILEERNAEEPFDQKKIS